jgi:hypothetical protein
LSSRRKGRISAFGALQSPATNLSNIRLAASGNPGDAERDSRDEAEHDSGLIPNTVPG